VHIVAEGPATAAPLQEITYRQLNLTSTFSAWLSVAVPICPS
jgi:hypothetical protein